MLVRASEGMGLSVRALVALAAIVPAGAMMSFGFPTGMRLVNAIDRRPTPWFWAVNGAGGVLAASVAVGTSIAFSINASGSNLTFESGLGFRVQFNSESHAIVDHARARALRDVVPKTAPIAGAGAVDGVHGR